MSYIDFITNTNIILEELQNDPITYLELLPQKDRDTFVEQWQLLYPGIKNISVEKDCTLVTRFICTYPVLAKQFFGDRIPEDNSLKFEPDAPRITEKAKNPNDVNPGIKNEVVSVGNKLVLALKEIKNK